MNNNSRNTKRIFKNTIILYLRMVVIMLITLYSSRIILQALGISDYGLYNVVGGVVLMLAFLRTSLTSATQRFLSFEMGRKDRNNLQDVFSICLSTHILISLIIIVIAETIGLWFLNTQIQIPEGREIAANWVFHFSVISLALSVVTVPYHACTISHERMSFFAWISILDAVLKLGFAYVLLITKSDRLIFYGWLMMMTYIINLFLYWLYDRKNFPETKYKFVWDKELFLQVFSFSGWTLWGQFAVVGSTHGKSILVNIFYSVTVNAAMGVAHQVNAAIVSLTSNFQTAFQPQLTKSYAAKDFEYMNMLICNASKLSFFMLFLASLPIMLNMDWVLEMWLTEVPEYSSTFCILYIIASILNALAAPLWICIFATGNIKEYQIVVSLAYLIEILVIFVLFSLGFPPTMAMVIKVVLNVIMVIIRLFYIKKTIENFSVTVYIRRVIQPLTLSTAITLLFVFVFCEAETKIVKIINSTIVIGISIISAYYIGLSKTERLSLTKIIKKRVLHN